MALMTLKSNLMTLNNCCYNGCSALSLRQPSFSLYVLAFWLYTMLSIVIFLRLQSNNNLADLYIHLRPSPVAHSRQEFMLLRHCNDTPPVSVSVSLCMYVCTMSVCLSVSLFLYRNVFLLLCNAQNPLDTTPVTSP